MINLEKITTWILIIKKNILIYYVKVGSHGRRFMNINTIFKHTLY